MKNVCKWVGLISLVVILLMPFVYLFDRASFSVMKNVLFTATLVWFGTAFFWIGKPDAGNLDDDPLL
jgi:hypothetical protein